MRATGSATNNNQDTSGCLKDEESPWSGDEFSGSNDTFRHLPEEVRELIYKQLQTQTLLQCRLVNREWNLEAAAVLRKFKKLCAVVRKPCSDYEHMSKSSLKICQNLEISRCERSPVEHNEQQMRKGDLSLLDGDAAAQFCWNLRQLSIQGFSNQSCPAIKIVKEIFLKARESLEELSLGSNDACRLAGDIAPVHTNGEQLPFPKLQRVRITTDRKFVLTRNFKHFLFESCKNLSQIIDEDGRAFEWNWGRYHEAACRKIARISIAYSGDSEDGPQKQQISRFCHASRHNLSHLTVEYCCDEDDDDNIWTDVAQLLRSSRNSLTKITTCPAVLVQLFGTSDQEPPFPNVKVLQLAVNYSELELLPLLRELLCRFNIGRTFPALNHFGLNLNHHGCECTDEVAASILATRQDPATQMIPSNAQELHISCNMWYDIGVSTISQVFPNVTKLEYSWAHSEETTDFSSIFGGLPRLESLWLSLNAEHYCWVPGYIDALLCGISLENAKELQKLSRQGLLSADTSLNNIGPRLLQLKNLKDLRVTMYGTKMPKRYCLLSELSGLLLFSKLPNLNVRIQGDSNFKQEIKRVEPYVDEAKILSHTEVSAIWTRFDEF